MKTNWYIWGATNHFRRPARFAVEATSEVEARARVYKLYDDHDHRFEVDASPRIMETEDDLHGATLHPQPTKGN